MAKQAAVLLVLVLAAVAFRGQPPDAHAQSPLLTLSLDGARGVYIQDESKEFYSYVMGAPTFVNAPFTNRWVVDAPSTVPPTLTISLGGARGVYIQNENREFYSYVIGAPTFVNASFTSRWVTDTPTPGPTPDPSVVCTPEATAARVTGSIALVTTSRGSGTAFYIGDSEWITAEHVVTGATGVRLTNATLDVTAAVVGVRVDVDLAVLSADPGSLTALAWGQLPNTGAEALVLGYGRGQQSLVAGMTQGIVSERYTQDGQTFIRTDAPANPGNSGGPLLDLCGNVTGLIQSKYVDEAVEGVAYALSSDSVQALLASVRAGASGSSPAAPTPDVSALTITAFCTFMSSEDVNADECHGRSTSLDTRHDQWNAWAEGVVDFADVVYRIDKGARFAEADMWNALVSLGRGCYELQIAEAGISTHWSVPYEFCLANAVPATSVPAVPTGLRLTNIDIPFEFDDIRVDWNEVPGATWYEVHHHAAGTQFDYEATVTNTYYLDEWPNVVYYNSYIVRACNASGCSPFSAAVTEN